mgnify:CR=1 FL=1
MVYCACSNHHPAPIIKRSITSLPARLVHCVSSVMLLFHFHPPFPVERRENFWSRNFLTGLAWCRGAPSSWTITLSSNWSIENSYNMSKWLFFSQLDPIATIFCCFQYHKPTDETYLRFLSFIWHLFHVSVVFHAKNMIFWTYIKTFGAQIFTSGFRKRSKYLYNQIISEFFSSIGLSDCSNWNELWKKKKKKKQLPWPVTKFAVLQFHDSMIFQQDGAPLHQALV